MTLMAEDSSETNALTAYAREAVRVAGTRVAGSKAMADLIRALEQAIGIIEAHVPEGALGDGGDECLRHMRAALAKAKGEALADRVTDGGIDDRAAAIAACAVAIGVDHAAKGADQSDLPRTDPATTRPTGLDAPAPYYMQLHWVQGDCSVATLYKALERAGLMYRGTETSDMPFLRDPRDSQTAASG